MNQPTDTDMLDWLDRQNAKQSYTGLCVFRWSTTGRGWRLQETGDERGWHSVRAAIADAMEQERNQ
jgi:hypothetical protein